MNAISLAGDVRGLRALNHLVDPSRNTDVTRDVFMAMATQATKVDAFTGAVIRASLEEHLAAGDGLKAEYWPPDDSLAAKTLHNLLGSMPVTCVMLGSDPGRDRLSVLPADVVRDLEGAELAALAIKAIGPHVRLQVKETQFLATAAVALAENGLRYASDSPCGVVVCAGVDPLTTNTSFVAIDKGSNAAAATRRRDVLRDAVERSRRRYGGLTNLLALSERMNLEVSLDMRTGTEQAGWRNRWHYGTQQFVPGWSVAITVHHD